MAALTPFSPGIGVFSAAWGNFVVQGGALYVDLKSYTPPLASASVFMVGNVAPNDGGQGFFVWNSTVIATDDNGLTAIVPYGASQGAWLRDDPGGNASQIEYLLSSTLGVAAANALPITVARRLDTFVTASDFGAKGDGVADDTLALQNAMNYLVTVGGTLWLGSGTYLISGAGLSINQSGLTTYNPTRVSIQGMGRGNTQIKYTGTGVALSYVGNTVSAGIVGLFRISDLYIIGPGPTALVGLDITVAADFTISDVLIQQFATGIQLVDCLSAHIANTVCNFNVTGLTAAMSAFSPPNALVFTSTTMGSNSTAGATITGPVTLTYNGGSIESNGTSSAGWGIQIIGAGQDGGAACTFESVYFENNANSADIMIEHSLQVPCTYNMIGCLFNRNSNTQFVTNNIVLNSNAGNGNARLNLFGCGFRRFGTYVADVSRPYIAINGGGGPTEYTDFGTVFQDAVEEPHIQGPTAVGKGLASAWVNFTWNGSAVLLADSRNVASVSRSGTGVYSIAFQLPMANASYIILPNGLSAGFYTPSSVTTTGFTLSVLNPSSAPVDPANVYIAVFGGGSL